MNLSTSLNIFYNVGVPIESAIERCSRVGFQALDFNLTDYQRMADPPFQGTDGEVWTKGIREKAESVGLKFTQLHAPIFNKFDPSPDTERLTAMSHHSLQVAAWLGVPWVVWEPEVFPGDFDSEHRRELFRRNHEFFDPLLDTAEKTGVGICIENCPDSGARSRNCEHWFGSEPEELAEFVDSFNHPLVGVCWDTGHAHMQGLDQKKALRIIGTRLKMTHIQDNDGKRDQHLLPFMGSVNWSEVMEALRTIDYQGDFTYEVHNAVRPLPDLIRDSALRYAVDIGRALIDGKI